MRREKRERFVVDEGGQVFRDVQQYSEKLRGYDEREEVLNKKIRRLSDELKGRSEQIRGDARPEDVLAFLEQGGGNVKQELSAARRELREVQRQRRILVKYLDRARAAARQERVRQVRPQLADILRKDVLPVMKEFGVALARYERLHAEAARVCEGGQLELPNFGVLSSKVIEDAIEAMERDISSL